jgi:hypothetical protein
MKTGLRSLMIAAMLSCTALAGGQAVAADQLLGTATFEPRPQRDVIEVGAQEGRFRGIRFEVRRSDVEILDLRVVYGNGSTDDLRVREVFRAGSSSRIIDLPGRRRAIKQIIVTYLAKGPARIQFFGVEGGGVDVAQWERLGCKDVRFLVDRDTLRVGRQEGRFRSIRVKVRQAPVEFFDLRVVYPNGRSQQIRARVTIPPGGVSNPIDLDGENRGIDRIEMIYRAIPTFKGVAEVCFEALPR